MRGKRVRPLLTKRFRHVPARAYACSPNLPRRLFMWFRPEQCWHHQERETYRRERFEDFGQIRPGVHLFQLQTVRLYPLFVFSARRPLLPLRFFLFLFARVERRTDVPPRVHLRRDRKSASFSFGHLCVVFASLMTPLLLPLSKETPTKSISRNPKKEKKSVGLPKRQKRVAMVLFFVFFKNKTNVSFLMAFQSAMD